VCYQIAAKNIGYDLLGIKAKWFLNTICTADNLNAPESVNIDDNKAYPFKEEAAYEQVEIKTVSSDMNVGTTSGSASGKIERIYEMLGKYTADYFTFNDLCEIVSMQYGNCVGNRLVVSDDGTLKLFLPNGHLTSERPYISMEGNITNVTNFANWLEKNGTDFFYVALPSPVSPDMETQMQAEGYQIYSNQMEDELLCGLSDNGTDYIDVRDYMESENKSYTDYFFQYEHHMIPEAGLWVAGKISEHIDSLEGTSADSSIFSLDSYEVTSAVKTNDLINNSFIVHYAKENIDFFHPKFSTDIKKYIYRYDMELTGDFDDVFYAMWEYPTYNTWNHGITAIKTYNNQDADEEMPRILLLTESYSDVISPFLACAYGEIDEIDLRFFQGSLQSYIEKTEPDLVIYISSAYMLGTLGVIYEFE
jgi:hypothetical protein